MLSSAAPSAVRRVTCLLKELRHAPRPSSRFGCEKYGTFTSPSCCSRNAVSAPEPIGDDHRPLRQKRFERRGAGGDEHAVRRGERTLRLAVEHRDRGARRVLRAAALEQRRARAASPSARRMHGPGLRAAIQRRRAMKSAPSRSTSPMRLPGSSATTARRSLDAERAPRALAIDLQRNLIRQRMPDELRAHAVLAVELRLERQQAQHEVHDCADGAHAPLPPGPHLRTHVLNRAQALVLQLLREPQIEVRRVDADEDVRPPRAGTRAQRSPRRRSSRGRCVQHFDEPHDRELVRGAQASQPAATIFGPAMPNELRHPAPARAARRSARRPACRRTPRRRPAPMRTRRLAPQRTRLRSSSPMKSTKRLNFRLRLPRAPSAAPPPPRASGPSGTAPGRRCGCCGSAPA